MTCTFSLRTLLPYVPLFGRSLLQLGTETEDFVRLTQRIGQKTGGIAPQAFTSTVRGQSEAAAWLFLRGKATVAQTPALLDILRDIVLTVKLDNRERFRQLALEERARLEAGLVPGGSSFVAQRLAARFTEAGWVSEQTGGVSYLFFLRELVRRIDSDWPGVLAALEQIRQTALHRGALIGNATVDADNWANVRPFVADFIAQLPSRAASPVRWAWQPGDKDRGTDDPGAGQLRRQGGQPVRARQPRTRVVLRHQQVPGDELAVAAGARAGRGLRRLLQLRPRFRQLQLRLVPGPELAVHAGRVRPDGPASCASRRWTRPN